MIAMGNITGRTLVHFRIGGRDPMPDGREIAQASTVRYRKCATFRIPVRETLLAYTKCPTYSTRLVVNNRLGNYPKGSRISSV
jgi:hypothetical protein